MEDLLNKYGYTPDNEAIARSVEIIAGNLDGMASLQVYKDCFAAMDLTTLHTNDSIESVSKLVGKTNRFQEKFPDFPLPASICVYPNFASVVASKKESSQVHVTSVCGSFPTSQTFVEAKVYECELAVKAGADEIDIVLALNKFLAGDYEGAKAEIVAMREAIDRTAAELGKKVVLKVILETGLLVTTENIAKASFLAMEAGADFIKTSTGKVDVNATPVSACVMCESIRAYFQKTGRKVGFKAAGGISTAADAVAYYSIVSSVLGKEWLGKSTFRLGVSRLGNALLSAAGQKTVVYF